MDSFFALLIMIFIAAIFAWIDFAIKNNSGVRRYRSKNISNRKIVKKTLKILDSVCDKVLNTGDKSTNSFSYSSRRELITNTTHSFSYNAALSSLKFLEIITDEISSHPELAIALKITANQMIKNDPYALFVHWGSGYTGFERFEVGNRKVLQESLTKELDDKIGDWNWKKEQIFF
jgi:hypothetical protein